MQLLNHDYCLLATSHENSNKTLKKKISPTWPYEYVAFYLEFPNFGVISPVELRLPSWLLNLLYFFTGCFMSHTNKFNRKFCRDHAVQLQHSAKSLSESSFLKVIFIHGTPLILACSGSVSLTYRERYLKIKNLRHAYLSSSYTVVTALVY